MSSDPSNRNAHGGPTSADRGKAARGLARDVYVLARGGVVGLVLWTNSRRILDWLAGWLTGRVAIGIMVAAVIVTGAANRVHKVHRAEIVSERRYSFVETERFSWPHHDLRVRRPIDARQGRLAAPSAAPKVWFVGLGDSIIHQVLTVVIRTGQGLVLLVPLLWLGARVQRAKLAAWRLEHGEGTAAYEAARAADDERRGAELTRDDWLVDPPWRRTTSARLPPRFGRKTG